MIHNSVAATLMARVERLIRANKKPFVAHNRGINFFFLLCMPKRAKNKIVMSKNHTHTQIYSSLYDLIISR